MISEKVVFSSVLHPDLPDHHSKGRILIQGSRWNEFMKRSSVHISIPIVVSLETVTLAHFIVNCPIKE